MKPKVLMVKLGPLDEEDPEERAKALADTGALIISNLNQPGFLFFCYRYVYTNSVHL